MNLLALRRRAGRSGRRTTAAVLLAVLVGLPAAAMALPARASGGDAQSAEEQQFIYELNQARWNPAAAGVAAEGVLPAPPLAVNTALAATARARVEEMAQFDYFAHQSPVTGLWPNAVARQHGYPLPPFWPDAANNIESLHFGWSTAAGALQSLLGSDAHRAHLLGQGWFGTHREIGVGAYPDERLWSVITATDGSGTPLLTGVVYADADGDGRLSLGEGLAGVTVTAGPYSTITGDSGGWSLPVAPGTYRVAAEGGAFAGRPTAAIRVRSFNVAVDFVSGRGAPVVYAYETCGGQPPTILGTGGNDVLWGTAGADVIAGGGGRDVIRGLAGNDLICGGAGDDTLYGGAGDDIIIGGPGSDRCYLGERGRGCEAG